MSDLKEQQLKECLSIIDNVIEDNNKELKKHIEEKIEQIIYERHNHRTIKYEQRPTIKTYYGNGQLESQTYYRENTKTGSQLCYNEKGILKYQNIYIDDNRQTIYYYEDGVTIKSKEIYGEEKEVINYDRDGSFIDHYIYDKEGKLIFKKHGKIHDLEKPSFEDLNFDKALKILFSCESITKDSISIKTQVDEDSNKIKLKITHGKNELTTELSTPEQLVNIGKALERIELYKKYSKK